MAKRRDDPGRLRVRDVAVMGAIHEQAPANGYQVKQRLAANGYDVTTGKLLMAFARLDSRGLIHTAPMYEDDPAWNGLEARGYNVTDFGQQVLAQVRAAVQEPAPTAK